MDRLAVSANANGLNHLSEYYASATGLRWVRILAEGGLVSSSPGYAALMSTGAELAR